MRGMVSLRNEKYMFSKSFAGEYIAFEKEDDLRLNVRFCEHHLGVVKAEIFSSPHGGKAKYPLRHFTWLREERTEEDVLAQKQGG